MSPGKRYRRTGVLFLRLEYEGPAADIFHCRSSDHPASKLSAAVDAINARMGRGGGLFAAEGVESKWKMKREMLSARFTTDWNELLVVR